MTTLTSHALPVELKDRQGTHIRFWPDKEGFHLLFRLIMHYDHFFVQLFNKYIWKSTNTFLDSQLFM